MTRILLMCLLALASLCSFIEIIQAVDGGFVNFTHHDEDDMYALLTNFTGAYPNITYLYTIGQSITGRELWVLAIAGHNPDVHIVGRPEAKYVANIHGDEIVGRELLLHFADYLLLNYGSDDEVNQFLDFTRLHLLISLNPDGYTDMNPREDCRSPTGRFNANGTDLNRNFPDYFEVNTDTIQPETQAVMNWIKGTQFVLSANLHGGILVANYPWDNTWPDLKGSARSMYSECPDDDVFQFLAKTYSYNHRRMHLFNETMCGRQRGGFDDGITNGADWYLVTGGMQDYNYMFAGCMEITLEVSCCKNPLEDTLPGFWDENRRALMEYIKQVHRGVKGLVIDDQGNPVEDARVTVVGRNDIVYSTTEHGEYWRILLGGNYHIRVEKEGYNTTVKSVQVDDHVYMVQQLDYTLSLVVDHDIGGAPPTAVSIVAVLMATLIGLLFQR